jgi:ATP synthase protein I
MSNEPDDQTTPPSGSAEGSFEERLREAKARQDKRAKGPGTGGRLNSRGMGVGFRIAVEMIAALAVGIGIGIGLDRWWGTTPWMMILFFILGSGAAFMNVIRVAQAYDRQVKAEREARKGSDRAEG